MKKIPLPVWFAVYLVVMYLLWSYIVPFWLPSVVIHLPKFLLAVWGGDVSANIFPRSVLGMYLAMVTIAGFVFLASDEGRWKRFKEPILDLLTPGPGQTMAKRAGRIAVLTILPFFGAYLVFLRLNPTANPPAEIRKVHPAPPDSVTVHGKEYKLQGLNNPFRVDDPAKQAQYTQEGKKIYYSNCFVCHGDAMNGQGMFAQGFNPPPADFADPGTIAMLTESFVFWRVSKGGPGLPEDSNTSWNSAMPVWETMLTEDEIWKAILWIYAGTGRKPRTWGDEGGGEKK